MSNEQKPMTVGDLKKAIADLPDEMPLVRNDDRYWDYFLATSLPLTTEIVEFCFVDGGETSFMRADALEFGLRSFKTKPIVVCKFTALEL